MRKQATIPRDAHDQARRLELAQDGSMKATEAAKFLGISETSVYELRIAGVLTFAKIHGKYVFPRKALVAYLAAQMQTGTIA